MDISENVIRGNDLDLTEMGLARTFKTNRSNLELLDIFNSTVGDDIKCRDLSVEKGWTNACPAQLVAALEEDLLMSDEEERINAEEEPDTRCTHSPLRLADYEDSERSESESGSSDSSSSKSYRCLSPNEPCTAGQLEEVEELERLVQLEEFDQSEEDSGDPEDDGHVARVAAARRESETSSNDEFVSISEGTFLGNEHEDCNKSVFEENVDMSSQSLNSACDTSFSSSADDSEEELGDLAKLLDHEVSVLEEQSASDVPTIADTDSARSTVSQPKSGYLDVDDLNALQLQQGRKGRGDPEICSLNSGFENRPNNAETVGDFFGASELLEEDNDVESLPDPEQSMLQGGEPSHGGASSDEAVGEVRSNCKQSVFAALARAKSLRAMRGDEPEKREVEAAGFSLDLQYPSSVTSFFATEEEKLMWESIDTSSNEEMELARAHWEADQLLAGARHACIRRAKRGGLQWCYMKQMRAFLEERRGSEEVLEVEEIVEEVWSRADPGRGTKRKRFRHYKDFITLRGTKYDVKTLAALLDPTSKCIDTLQCLASEQVYQAGSTSDVSAGALSEESDTGVVPKKSSAISMPVLL